MAENIFVYGFNGADNEKVKNYRQRLSNSDIPTVWGLAIKNQMDTLVAMLMERQVGLFDRSCLEESPVLTKAWDERMLVKPVHVGTVWPTLVNGRMQCV